MEEILPSGNHFLRAEKAVSSGVGEGMVLGHGGAQRRQIFLVNGLYERASNIDWRLGHGVGSPRMSRSLPFLQVSSR
jgi:hypothetical protein